MNFIKTLIARFFPQTAEDYRGVLTRTITNLENLSARKANAATRYDDTCLKYEKLAANAAADAMVADIASEDALKMVDSIRHALSIPS